MLPNALGALGRRFEPCCPDSIKTKSYKRVTQTLFLLFTFSHEKGALGEALSSINILNNLEDLAINSLKEVGRRDTEEDYLDYSEDRVFPCKNKK